MWRLHNTLLKDQWVIEEIKTEKLQDLFNKYTHKNTVI